MTTTHPHRIDPLPNTERRRSRNCLRIDTPYESVEPRCNLRPCGAMAQWILEHRPYHLRESITLFDYCINDQGCDACRIYQAALNTQLFRRVPIIVRPNRGRMVVLALGSCVWYDLHTGEDINAAGAWVRAHGGALGGHGEDAFGRYRNGFINGYTIPYGLRPPFMQTGGDEEQKYIQVGSK